MKTSVDAKQLYQDSAVRGATPIELVVVLYDSAIEKLRGAIAAMEKNDAEGRSTQVGQALLILQQLQGTLDFERGGGPARQFEQFYNLVRAKLLEAQIRGSRQVLEQQIRALSDVRDCWVQARRLLQPTPGAPVTPQVQNVLMQEKWTQEWKA